MSEGGRARVRETASAQRQGILRALGLAAVAAPIACGANVVFEGLGDGGAGGRGEDDGGPSTVNGPFPPDDDGSGAYHAQGGSTISGFGGFGASGQGGGLPTLTVTCFPPTANGACADLMTAPSVYGDCTWSGEKIVDWVSGPTGSPSGDCCYEVAVSTEFCGAVGRPFIVDDLARRAPAATRRDWRASAADDRNVDPVAREAAARGWLEDALAEHASIAAFARVSLELLALGAPADLVADTHAAALDEIEHARISFGLASRFGAGDVGPGPMPSAASAGLTCDLASFAAATFIEGCLGETVAAAVAREALARATDTAVRAALARIAVDEERHAALAYRTVAWALSVGGEPVRTAIEGALARVHEPITATHAAGGDIAEALGRLGPAAVGDVTRVTIRQVVRPCASALLRAC